MDETTDVMPQVAEKERAYWRIKARLTVLRHLQDDPELLEAIKHHSLDHCVRAYESQLAAFPVMY